MAYYDKLIAKWPELNTSTPLDKIAEINALTVPGPPRQVPISEIMNYLRTNNLWLPIKAAAAAGTCNGAVAAVDYNSDPRAESLDFTLPIVQAMLADIVSHGLLTQEQSDALVALSVTNIPWCRANGYPEAQNGGGGITEVDLLNAGLS